MIRCKDTLLKNLEGMGLDDFGHKYYHNEDFIYDFIYDYNVYCDIENAIIETLENVDNIIEFQNELECIIADTCENAYDNYMNEFIDGLIDIYYVDLMNWLSKHYFDNIEWMELPVMEGLIDFNNYNFTNHIQSAQWCCYQSEIDNEWNDLPDELIKYFEEGMSGML